MTKSYDGQNMRMSTSLINFNTAKTEDYLTAASSLQMQFTVLEAIMH